MTIPYVFKSFEDLVALPDAELANCLTSLRNKIAAIKLERAAAARSGVTQFDPFTSFSWQPRINSPIDVISVVRPETPITELGLRPSAVRRLKELQIFCLEDCAEAFEGELLRQPDVGNNTVVKVSEYLSRVGLSFKEDPDPVRARNNIARSLRVAHAAPESTAIGRETAVEMLGLRATAFRRLVTLKINTVGELLDLTAHQFAIQFGTTSRMEIYARLRQLGFDLSKPPTTHEQWRYGLLKRSELPFPSEIDPVIQLQPWLGQFVLECPKQDINTIEDLKQVLNSDGSTEASKRFYRNFSKHFIKTAKTYFAHAIPGAKAEPT